VGGGVKLKRKEKKYETEELQNKKNNELIGPDPSPDERCLVALTNRLANHIRDADPPCSKASYQGHISSSFFRCMVLHAFTDFCHFRLFFFHVPRFPLLFIFSSFFLSKFPLPLPLPVPLRLAYPLSQLGVFLFFLAQETNGVCCH
jgi:hypothetical protein